MPVTAHRVRDAPQPKLRVLHERDELVVPPVATGTEHSLPLASASIRTVGTLRLHGCKKFFGLFRQDGPFGGYGLAPDVSAETFFDHRSMGAGSNSTEMSRQHPLECRTMEPERNLLPSR